MRRRSERAALAVVTAALVAALALPGCRRRQPEAAADAAPSVDDAPVMTERVIEQPRPGPPDSFERIVEALRPSLVNIQSSTKVRGGPASMFPGASLDSSLGSGFVVERPGYVLTNFHVVRRAPEIHVVLADGEQHAASLLAWDERLDIALLALTDPPELAPAPLAEDGEIAVGAWVVALGAPFPGSVSANPGVVSALPRPDYSPVRGTPPHNYAAFLQTDAAVHEGNTGGPLVDLDGRVVGLNVIGKARDGRIGFAVPIARLRRLLPHLIDGGAIARSWLGVRVLPVTRELAEQLGYPAQNGAYVSEVPHGGPAALAGLRVGDIIASFDGQEVTDRNLPFLIELTPPRRRVVLEVWRDRARVSLPVVTAAMPK